MGRHVAGNAPDMDILVEEASRAIGREIEAMGIPRLRGVVLGGGYGRGEGGVFETEGGRTLSNDLDFYVVADDGSSVSDLAAIDAALEPLSHTWSAKLGIDVDFCTAKTPWRMNHDRERVMIQELVHGYFDVAGEKGESMFAGIERRRPEDFPWMEAARLMMNRGAGLLFASEPERTPAFKVRNVNKCILGAGDARLIARGEYAWRAEERARRLGDGLYSKALAWKFRPSETPVCDWETARGVWLDAQSEVMAAGRAAGALKRSIRQAARWIVRRRTFGEMASSGQDCVVRVLRGIGRSIEERGRMDGALLEDWRVFN